MDRHFELIMACILLIVALCFVGFSVGVNIANQSAICHVLEKHVPNRVPEVIDGECTMLVGVSDIRVRMPVAEYGGMILEDER